jgi:hypothetical protein
LSLETAVDRFVTSSTQCLLLIFAAMLMQTPHANAQHCNSDYPTQSLAKSALGTIDIPWVEWVPAVMPFDRSTVLPVTITAKILGGAGGNLGCSFTSNGTTLTATAQPSQIFAYNDFELYLMSMVPSIANGFVVNDQPAIRNAILNNPNRCTGTYALSTTAFSQATLTASAGARIPSSTSAPKYFRVLTLVASSGRTLGDDELRYISFMTARAQTPGTRLWAEGLAGGSGGTFYEATGERARLDFRLDGVFASGFEGN